MTNWREDRVGSATRGENPLVMARMRGGVAVIGDTQFLPGYSLLLTDDPAAAERGAPEHASSDEKHGELRATITAELDELIQRVCE